MEKYVGALAKCTAISLSLSARLESARVPLPEYSASAEL